MNRLKLFTAGLLCCLLFDPTAIFGQFVQMTTPSIPQAGGDAQWGDMDSDGDLDLVILGFDNEAPICKIAFNDGNGNFSPGFLLGLEGLSSEPSIALGDYNQDGLVDIAIAGRSEELNEFGYRKAKTLIYRNTGGGFIRANDALKGVLSSDLEWGDYDNDGDLDLLASGYVSFEDRITGGFVFKNVGNDAFETIELPVGVTNGEVSFGDVDNDGDLDIAAVGRIGPFYPEYYFYADILINQGNDVFVEGGFNLLPVWYGTVEWADLDNDGDLDLLFSGVDNSFQAQLYAYENDLNLTGDFIQHGPYIDYYGGNIAMNDFNFDGLPDFVISAYDNSDTPRTMIFQNNDDFDFTEYQEIEGHNFSIDWGDYDGDGNLDLAATGSDPYYRTSIFRNELGLIPVTPNIPTDLTSLVDENSVNLSWTNPELYTNGYNVNVVGPDGPIVLPSVNWNNKSMIPHQTSSYPITFMNLDGLQAGTYYWSVQAVSPSDQLSSFSEEQTFDITQELPVDPSPYSLAYISIDDSGFPNKLDFRIGDIDNDFDYDLIIQEDVEFFEVVREQVFRFNKSTNTFVAIPSHQLQTSQGRIASQISEFANMSNDDLLDLINYRDLYANTGNSFEKRGLFSSEEYISKVVVLDYDSDGDEDVVKSASLLHNNGMNIVDRISPMTEYIHGRSYDEGALVYDLNNDGRLQFFNTWQYSEVLLNSGTMEEVSIPILTTLRDKLREDRDLIGQREFIQMLDMDFDGDPDFVVVTSNRTFDRQFVCLYINDNQSIVLKDYVLVDVGISAPHQTSHNLQIADMDGDMIMDILVGYHDFTFGNIVEKSVSVLIKNNNNESLQVVDQFDGLSQFFDHDLDGDLDILELDPFQLHLNSTDNFVDLTAPYNPNEVIEGDTILLEWDYDGPAHSYEIHIEYSPFDKPDYRELILGSKSYDYEADPELQHLRRVYAQGNSANSKKHLLTNLKDGTYYWKVQTILPNLGGSYFTEERSFEFRRFQEEFTHDFPDLVSIVNCYWVDLDINGTQEMILDMNTNVGRTMEVYSVSNTELTPSEQSLQVLYEGSTIYPIGFQQDFNDDGKLDFYYYVRDPYEPRIAVWEEPFTFRYDPDLTTKYLNVQNNYYYDGLLAFDLDRDGKVDPIILDDLDRLIIDYSSRESDTLNINLEYPTVFDAFPDINNDGFPDLVVFNNSKINTYLNSETGFDESNVLELFENLFGISALSNFDNDAFIDLFGSNLVLNSLQGLKSVIQDGTNGYRGGVNIDFTDDGLADIINNESLAVNMGNHRFNNYDRWWDIDDPFSPSWVVDFDNDMALNFVNVEYTDVNTRVHFSTRLTGNENNPPSPPTTFEAIHDGNTTILSWAGASDDLTPYEGLYYNLIVKSATDTLVHSYTNSDGKPLFLGFGNARNVEKYSLIGLQDGEYSWAVQTIDNSLKTSVFSADQHFVVCADFESQIPSIIVGEDLGVNADISFRPSTDDEFLTYEWDFGDGNIAQGISVIHSYSGEDSFLVTLTMTNIFGCSVVSSQSIEVQNEVPVRMANVITPNGDGKNDFLYVEHIERYPNNSLSVYNSSGQLIYFKNGYNNDWFGVVNGKSIPTGSYLCVLKLDGFQKEIRQIVNVLR